MSTPHPPTSADILAILKEKYGIDLNVPQPPPSAIPSLEYLQLVTMYDVMWMNENPHASFFNIGEAIARVTSALGCINARLYLLEQQKK